MLTEPSVLKCEMFTQHGQLGLLNNINRVTAPAPCLVSLGGEEAWSLRVLGQVCSLFEVFPPSASVQQVPNVHLLASSNLQTCTHTHTEIDLRLCAG